MVKRLRPVLVAIGALLCIFAVTRAVGFEVFTPPETEMLTALAGCQKQEAHDVTDAVLTAAQVACIETGDGAQITDVDQLASVCRILRVPLLRDLLHALIGQRDVARKAGFRWPEAVRDASAE